jgi:RNA polymerase sigma-70 factor (ECF subfamily)
VAQEVFLDLWTGRHQYAPGGRFKGYLATLTLNRCRDATRRRGAEQRRRAGLAAEGFAPQRDACDSISRQESAKRLHAVLARLSAEDREILVMRFGMDLQYDDIAEAMGRPAGTLRSRVFHALRAMRSMLEEA